MIAIAADRKPSAPDETPPDSMGGDESPPQEESPDTAIQPKDS